MRRLLISVLLSSIGLTASCDRDGSTVDSKSAQAVNNSYVASTRKEIIAQTVLSVQLAPHNEIETRTTFAATEPVPASLYLTDSAYIEPRRIIAFLVSNEAVVEEQSIAVKANEKRQEFDFRFTKTPRPSGAYQIKFVEIARSNGRPVLLARLFLHIE
jgi:hypothetical protein